MSAWEEEAEGCEEAKSVCEEGVSGREGRSGREGIATEFTGVAKREERGRAC